MHRNIRRAQQKAARYGAGVFSATFMPVSTVSGVAWHALDSRLKGTSMTFMGAATSVVIDRALGPVFTPLGNASGHWVGRRAWDFNKDMLGYGLGQMGP